MTVECFIHEGVRHDHTGRCPKCVETEVMWCIDCIRGRLENLELMAKSEAGEWTPAAWAQDLDAIENFTQTIRGIQRID